MLGTGTDKGKRKGCLCSSWDIGKSAGVVLGLPGLPLQGTLGVSLRLPSAFVLSRGAVLLLLQADSCEAGRPPLLPGLTVAAKGVHASPKVTTSCPVDEYLSFLVEAAGLLSREGHGRPKTCSAFKKEDSPGMVGN